MYRRFWTCQNCGSGRRIMGDFTSLIGNSHITAMVTSLDGQKWNYMKRLLAKWYSLSICGLGFTLASHCMVWNNSIRKFQKPLKRNPAAMFNKIITSWRTAPDGKRLPPRSPRISQRLAPRLNLNRQWITHQPYNFDYGKGTKFPNPNHHSFQWSRSDVAIWYESNIYIYDMNHIYISYILYIIYMINPNYTHIYIYILYYMNIIM